MPSGTAFHRVDTIRGASRPFWYQQIKDGKIKTALIKQPGRQRGMRLVWRPSVLAFIEQYAVKGE